MLGAIIETHRPREWYDAEKYRNYKIHVRQEETSSMHTIFNRESTSDGKDVRDKEVLVSQEPL